LKTLINWSVLAILLIAAGCDSGPGPDSLISPPSGIRRPASECTRCHNSVISPAMDPLVSNGSGTFGKHVKHVQERRIACERCHYRYQDAPTHMNGTFDTGNPAINLVTMDIVGPAGIWSNDTGTGTGSCAGVACHANATLDWYGTNTWTLPAACTTCHTSDYSADLDPTVTNGTPPAGRHVKHVTSRAIDCEHCHDNYPSATTHANGVLDTGDPDVSLVRFNIVGPAALWTNDTGTRTGDCSSVACHGTDTLSWYGTGTWTLPAACTTCHSSSYSSVLDPVATNGSGLAGKHVPHVADYGFACSKCHLDYPTKTSHANGSLDTPDPSVLLVYFDATNPTGTWINDTGPETGNCSSLFCHGTDEPAWYGLGGVSTPPCVVCHGGPMGSRRQIFGAGGDFGQNTNNRSHHVSGSNDPTSTQCRVCHDLSQHMGGTVLLKNADGGSAIAYDPATPSSAEPFCLSCHDRDGAASTFATGGTPTSPFIDGSVLGSPPYPYATRIYSSWTSTIGHGTNGNHGAGKKLTCLGSGQPGTGCHGSTGKINAHGSVNQVIAAQPFKYDNTDMYNAADFALCFGCHAAYPGFTKEDILGVKQGGILDWEYGMAPYGGQGANGWNPPYYIPAVKTHFVDHNEINGIYNDTPFWGENMNLHWSHIGILISDFRGTGITSGSNCVNCHDVHGSNIPYGAVYDEMGYTNFSDGTNILGQMTLSAYSTTLLNNHPFYCAFNCHPTQDVTKAWFSPIVEGP
jgi:hypothetical protein